jgi:hypothetical protein
LDDLSIDDNDPLPTIITALHIFALILVLARGSKCDKSIGLSSTYVLRDCLLLLLLGTLRSHVKQSRFAYCRLEDQVLQNKLSPKGSKTVSPITYKHMNEEDLTCQPQQSHLGLEWFSNTLTGKKYQRLIVLAY